MRDQHNTKSIARVDTYLVGEESPFTSEFRNYSGSIAGRGDLQVRHGPGFRAPTDYGGYSCQVVPHGDFAYPIAGGLAIEKGSSHPPHDLYGVKWGMSSTGYDPSGCENLLRRAIAEAKAKVVDGDDVHLGTLLAEMPDTVRMVESAVSSIWLSLRDARRGRWRKAAKHLGVSLPTSWDSTKDWASLWLALQFGWKPLMSDIETAITKTDRPDDAILSVVRRVSDSFVPQNPVLSGAVYSGVTTGTDERFAEAKYYYKVSDPTMFSLNQRGLVNPLEVAWEVVPFSFFIDWFIPVNHWLTSWSSMVGTDFIGGYHTYGRRVNAETRLWDYSEPEPSGQYTPNTFTVSNFIWKRDSVSIPPRTQLYWKVPFSATKGITALALLRKLS